MEIAFGERLGLAGLIMALVAIAVPILWPDKKVIGWLCLLAVFVLAIWWLWIEFHLQIPNYYQKSPVRSTLAVFLTGGIISAGLWLLIMGGKPSSGGSEKPPEKPVEASKGGTVPPIKSVPIIRKQAFSAMIPFVVHQSGRAFHMTTIDRIRSI
jgi:hypothetical protein